MRVVEANRDFELKGAVIHGGFRSQTIAVKQGTTGLLEESGRVTFQAGSRGSYTGVPPSDNYTIVV